MSDPNKILEEIERHEVIPKLARYLNDNINVGYLKETQLVEKYDPDEPNNIFGQELAKRFPAGSTFLVFKADGTFDRDSTIKEVEYLKRHNNVSRSRATYNGTPHQTYALGKRPPQYAEANPYDGTILDENLVSENGVDWSKVSDETRQLVYVAFQKNQANEPNTQKFGEYQLFQYLTTGKETPFEIAKKTFQSSYFVFEDYRNQGALASINKIAKPTNSAPSPSSGNPAQAGTTTNVTAAPPANVGAQGATPAAATTPAPGK